MEHHESFPKAINTVESLSLKPLNIFNSERRKFHNHEIYPKPNGIECPMCGNEMGDSDNITLTSIPPQRKIECLNKDCKHINYRIV